MEFYIKKGATLPILELEILEDGINNNNEFYKQLQNAHATINIYKDGCGSKAIKCKTMDIIEVNCGDCNSGCYQKFNLVYKWSIKDTKKTGRYYAEIDLKFLDGCGVLKLPIREKLYINII